MKCPVMIKYALNALKARELAKSVGLIPHPQSQWKWALRNMRKTNPAGIKGAPLMQAGRELAKTKERIGKLPNNVAQKMKALSRKQRLGVEVGLTDKNNILIGSSDGVINFDNYVAKAHTHPAHNKIIEKANYRKINKILPLDSKEYLRGGDKVLSASPSGIDYTWNNIRDYPLHKKILKAKGELFNKNMRNKPTSDKAKLVFTINRLNSEKMYAYPIADARIIKMDKIPHNIIAKNVTGIHKYRQKLPRAMRSVYFKGGLD